MLAYSQFRPTACDNAGLGCDDRQSWLVAPVGLNRDSGPLERSNWRVVLADLGGEGIDVEVHRFGHWACGWFEVILVRPDTAAAVSAEEWEGALSDYPVASDEDFSNEEQQEADAVWSAMGQSERLAYMRKHASQFDCSWLDLLANARGTYFSGYASDLLH